MKKLIAICTIAAFAAAAHSQTVYIWKDNVATAVSAAAAGDFVYTRGGTVLTVLNTSFNIADIDSITLGAPIDEQTVSVAYSGSKATAVVPIGLAQTVSVAISGAYVSATSTATDGDDIVYALSGTSSDGAFLQNGTYKCTLALNGVNLTSRQGAAIEFVNGKRINVVLADGSTNTLADFAGGLQRGCFRVKGHPEFSGNGTLNVTGNANHGISTSEYMQVKSGTINVLSAVNDGIHAGQYFMMDGGKVSVSNTKGDGIQADVTTDVGDTLNGQMIINGGQIDVAVTSDDVKGIRSDSNMTINGGSITVNMSGAGVKGIAADGSLAINQSAGATTNIRVTVSGGIFHENQMDESKTRGVRVKGNFDLLGGTLNVTANGKKAKSVKVDGTSTRSRKATSTLRGNGSNDFSFDRTVN